MIGKRSWRPGSMRVLLPFAAAAAATTVQAQAPAPPSPAPLKPPREVTFAIGGDLLGPYLPVTRLGGPGFAEVRGILGKIDATFANFVARAFDLPSLPGWPAWKNGGGTPLSTPASIADTDAVKRRIRDEILPRRAKGGKASSERAVLKGPE